MSPPALGVLGRVILRLSVDGMLVQQTLSVEAAQAAQAGVGHLWNLEASQL